jgi:thiol-disulfide isomerase/thioredoxin
MPVVEIKNYKDYTNFLNNKKCIIFFGSEMCGFCKTIAPVFEKLSNSKKYSTVKFAHVETSKVKTKNIAGVPVFVARPTEEVVTGANEKAIINMLDNLIRS